jgi:aspartate kinase
MIVAKFGGTSMGTSQSITQVTQIVEAKKGKMVAVVSATSGTTDSLIQLGNLALNQEENSSSHNWEQTLTSLIAKHDKILAELSVELDLSKYWDEIQKLLKGIELTGELSRVNLDKLSGFGERISSQILAANLNAQNIPSQAVDAFQLIRTDNTYGEGKVNFPASEILIQEKLGALIEQGITPVVTGFVAQSEEGKNITLGRGGSDYSGAIIASSLNADELQIWTDVDGILSADPRIIKTAQVLPTLCFSEAGELAYFGAKVLHPKTIKPAIQKNIPVRILNTFNTQAPGTLIAQESDESIKSVTYRKNVIVVNICAAELLEAHGFLAKIFEVFGRHEVVVDVVSTSEVSVSLTVDELPNKVLEELQLFSNVEVQEDMAIVCLVGNGIKSDSHVLGKLFTSIAGHDVSMVSQGASKRNITFLAAQAEVPEMLQKIYNTFFPA